MRVGRRARSPGAQKYSNDRLPAAGTPWREASYCAVDLELSGLNPSRDEILSFGAIPIEDGRVQLGGAVEGLVRPQGAISAASIRVHGLRSADLLDAPLLDEAIEPLLGVMAGRIPIVHSASVERGFLGPALRRKGLKLHRPMIDTGVLGLVWLRERDGTGPGYLALPALASELGLPSHRPHDAVGDALTTAQVFIALATLLDARRAETVRSLVHAERRLRAMISYPTR